MRQILATRRWQSPTSEHGRCFLDVLFLTYWTEMGQISLDQLLIHWEDEVPTGCRERQGDEGDGRAKVKWYSVLYGSTHCVRSAMKLWYSYDNTVPDLLMPTHTHTHCMYALMHTRAPVNPLYLKVFALFELILCSSLEKHYNQHTTVLEVCIDKDLPCHVIAQLYHQHTLVQIGSLCGVIVVWF